MKLTHPAIRLAGALLLGTLGALIFQISATSANTPLLNLVDNNQMDLVIGDTPSLTNTPRIGINLGQWTSWGAEQLSRNILKNPGFEGIIDRALVRVSDIHRHGFSDDESWLARADGFWAGADFQVLTGSATGQSGQILDSVAKNAKGRPEYRVTGSTSGLAEGDIIALTIQRDHLLPDRWWIPQAETAFVRPNSSLTPPGSPGLRSIGLHASTGSSVQLAHHLDTIGERAGKLLQVNGLWQLGLWVHGEKAGAANLQIRFHRHGSTPFIHLQHPVKPGWHYLEHRFDATDAGPIGALELELKVTSGVVHLDDIWLGPLHPNPLLSDKKTRLATETFNPYLISLLQRIRPGYLRDWQGQLGDTLNNRLATPFARRTSRYRPGDSDFSYGLAEFIDLSHLIGAQPWIVLPTTFSTNEALQLGAWLAEKITQYEFQEVIVEFGNENWNTIFRPAGIQDPLHHGAAADHLFIALRKGAEGHPAIRTAINAQHANPYAALQFAVASQTADILGLAPYFLNRLDASDRGHEQELLFAGDGGRMAQIVAQRPRHQQVAVYEINLHTTRGDMPKHVRDAVVTSNEAGAALAQNLLKHLNLGVRRQNVYRLTGYDTFLQDRSDLTKLFGIAYDLAQDSRLRATGTAVEMLNRVIGGDLHPIMMTSPSEGFLTASAFRHDRGWAVAMVSASPNPQTVRLQFPGENTPLPAQIRFLGDTATPLPLAYLITERGIQLTLPPYSLVTMEPKIHNDDMIAFTPSFLIVSVDQRQRDKQDAQEDPK